MDFWLNFKSRSHSDLYYSNFEFQLQKKLFLALVLLIMHSAWLGVDYGIHFYQKSAVISSWMLIRTLVCILWIISVYWIKKRSDQFAKRAKLVLFILDVLALISTADILPLTKERNLIGMSLVICGWNSGVYFVCSIMLIGAWQLRIFACFLQLIMCSVIILIHDDIPKLYLLNLAHLLVIYISVTYLCERFWRREFLKKTIIHEDSEAIRKVLDDVLDGILIIDCQKRVLYLNDSAEKIFEEKISTIEGVFQNMCVRAMADQSYHRHCAEGVSLLSAFEDISKSLLHPEGNHPSPQFIVVEGFRKCIQSETMKRYQIKFAKSVYNDKCVIVANISDTTERYAFRSLQDDNNYKTRLFASVSHELRTPLNGSINFIEQALSDSGIPTAAKNDYILPALRSNRMLLCLINDFLDFSQMQANKLRLVFERKNIVETAKDCMELLEIQASKRGIYLKLDSSLSADREMLLSDHNRLKQIVLNFLSNAVKFTFEGGITLKLEEVMLSGYRGVRIRCDDSGIGISEENKKKMFQAFEKIELGSQARINATGVGLGLVISNNLAELLNQGANVPISKPIQFESSAGRGSSFWVDIVDRRQFEIKSPTSAIQELSIEQGMNEKNLEDVTIEFRSLSTKSKLSVDKKGEVQDYPMNTPIGSARNLMEYPRSNLSSSTFSPKCKCSTVLIVDDDSFNLTALDQNLQKLKINCDWAFNGMQALQKIQKRQSEQCCLSCEQYKVVFLDCNMPVLDGFETAKALRKLSTKEEISGEIKIIACTAFVQASELDQALAAGMDDFCTKPISLKIIREKLLKFGIL